MKSYGRDASRPKTCAAQTAAHTWLVALLMALSMQLAATSAIAQTITGTIRGTVTDSSGAAIPAAAVTAKNDATGVATATVSDRSGLYNVQFLPIGPYTITASAPGFKTSSIGPFTLQIDQTAKIDAKLQVGDASATVDVSSDTSPILQTQDATLGTTISTTTLQNLPMNGLNFQTATLFVPGSVDPTAPQMAAGNGNERNTTASGVASFNGNRQQTNNYILDGVEINETLNNVSGYNPAPDSLQEIRVITANANAEYGNVNGGEVLMVTKGGTNQFHGSVYEYFEDDPLSANSWGNNFAGVAKTPYTQNQFGATIGGPIKRNKLFFFGDYEGFRYHSGGPAAATVATAQMRTGDFSQVLAVQGIQLFNTQTGGGLTTATPYPNNKIPINNPVAKFLFANPQAYPLPNKTPVDGLDQDNYLGYSKGQTVNNQGDVRVDYTASSRDTLMGRYTIGDAYDLTTHAVLPTTFPTTNDYPFQSIVGNWVHTFSPSLINEFRVGFSRVRTFSGAPTDPSGIFGLTGNNKVGIPFSNQPYPGFSEMDLLTTNESNVGTDALATQFVDNTFDYGDDLTWQHGRHTSKVGVQIVRYQQNSFYPGNSGTMGIFDYNGTYTANSSFQGNGNTSAGGYAFADFLLNQSENASIGGVAGPTGQRQYRDAVYAQDDWRVLPNLTVNLGLRYSFDQPIYEVNNKMLNVDLATPSVGAAALQFAGMNGNSRALYNPYYLQFMPRVGFALQADRRTVLRGGYGITDAFEGTGTGRRLTQNPPFLHQFVNIATTPSATSGGTPLSVANGFNTSSGDISVASTAYSAYPQNLRPSLVQQFNLTGQCLITDNISAQLGYVGEVGQHLITPVQLNQLSAPGAPAPFFKLVGQSGTVVATESGGISNYNAMQASIHRQSNNGLDYTLNYTWSKAMTNNSGFYGVSGVNSSESFYQNAFDPQGDYGVSGLDTRNALNGNAVYPLPFGRGQQFGSGWSGITDEALGGWRLSGDVILYSGFPITMASPKNYSVNSDGVHANQYLPLHLRHQTVQNWFGTDPSAVPCKGAFNGTCAYGVQLPTGFGNAHNGTERAPGYQQIDLSAFKTFRTFESQTLQFRVDGFNVFNIASYGPPNSTLTSGLFGQITSTQSSQRVLQLSLHYKF